MVSLGLSATVVRTALVAESVTISRVDSKDHHLQFSCCTFKVKTGKNVCDNTLSTYVLYMLPTTLCVALFPGPAQLSVTISTVKRERAWYLFSRE